MKRKRNNGRFIKAEWIDWECKNCGLKKKQMPCRMRNQFCSLKCAYAWRKGKPTAPFSEEHRKNIGKAHKGKGKHNMAQTAFYNVWIGIKQRCGNTRLKAYPRYGGRGIKCEWKSFEEFMADMYPSYLKHKAKNTSTTIERIDNDGNYCKRNCKWITQSEQTKNRHGANQNTKRRLLSELTKQEGK